MKIKLEEKLTNFSLRLGKYAFRQILTKLCDLDLNILLWHIPRVYTFNLIWSDILFFLDIANGYYQHRERLRIGQDWYFWWKLEFEFVGPFPDDFHLLYIDIGKWK